MNSKEITGKLIGCILFIIGLTNIIVIENTRMIQRVSSAITPLYPGFSGTFGVDITANWSPLIFPIILSIIGLFLIVINYDKK